MSAAVKKVDQPESFVFSKGNLAKAEKIIAQYPSGRQQSAVLPLLDLAQRQSGNWLPKAAMDYVAEMLDMAPIRVYEVASFYTMFNLAPVGKNLIQICRTTPCWLRGSDEITKSCKENAGANIGETSTDGLFSLMEVECLGACVNAPVVQINDHYYEDLTATGMAKIIEDLKAGRAVKPGSQIGRKCSAPVGVK